MPRLQRAPLLLQVADESGEALLPGALDYAAALAAASSEAPNLAHSPDDLYVLYTGGTTGMPKGTLWRQADIFDAVFRLPGVKSNDLDELAGIAAAAGAAQRLVPNAPFMHGAAHWLGVRALTRRRHRAHQQRRRSPRPGRCVAARRTEAGDSDVDGRRGDGPPARQRARRPAATTCRRSRR